MTIWVLRDGKLVEKPVFYRETTAGWTLPTPNVSRFERDGEPGDGQGNHKSGATATATWKRWGRRSARPAARTFREEKRRCLPTIRRRLLRMARLSRSPDP